MLNLSREKNLKTLRWAARVLDEENAKLIRKNIELTKEILELKGQPQMNLALKIEELERQLAARNKKLFGDSSERRPRGTETVQDEKPAEPKVGHGPTEQPKLPLVEQIHRLDEADKVCPQCGGNLKEWAGQFEASEEIHPLKRSFVVIQHKRQKYRCQCGSCVDTALGPPKLIAGGRYSPEFGCEVAAAKYLDHLPLERQVRIMQREGLVVTSQTLWDQIEALATHLAPVKEALRQYVLSQPVIGADETHWKLMGPKGFGEAKTKRWQVWAATASDAVIYQIEDSRGLSAAESLLGDYRGIVMADGYGAYQGLRKRSGSFVLAHCWAHVRRKFVEIEDFFPAEAKAAIDQIGELYAIERLCPTGPPGDPLRRKLRQERSRAVIARIEKWAFGVRGLPHSGLGKAVAYLTGLWGGLTQFLDDPRIPLDNNATERALRGVVIGRKNHYGSRSQRGTEVAALFYSLCESAKLNHLDPSGYLRTAIQASLRAEPVLLPHQLAAQLTPSIAA